MATEGGRRCKCAVAAISQEWLASAKISSCGSETLHAPLNDFFFNFHMHPSPVAQRATFTCVLHSDFFAAWNIRPNEL